ncbi:hypothetical protein PIB30_085955, partial [Stylosanthes scabra]|nr:hypothetical protein [Stylosanthes scabra]
MTRKQKENGKISLETTGLKQQHIALHPWNQNALTSEERCVQIPAKKAIRVYIEEKIGTFREKVNKSARKESHERFREKAHSKK